MMMMVIYYYYMYYKAKTKNWEILKLTKILSWSVLSGKLFHGSQHTPNPWLLLV